ncbi:cytochrome P450, family 72, subfamily A, polypeptide 10 [Hibiscus trionum]|uniref:Cytochrome P450, family 72, subfamily A, polypeptide 10 n=1 Tax=Hibiscus trionum TaxID=183268 RepID=A0A9W7IV50_HIBTR|nr:cytochrome P450, family 72, subfamily A, polypeptide 10 [Hibiscus trionum]
MSVLMKLAIFVPCSFFLVALVKFLYDYLWTPLRIQHIMNSQGIKGPPYRFIHGNNNQVTRMKNEASSKPMSLTRHDVFPRVQPHVYSWLNTYGKNYLSWNGVQAELVISEPELVKEVLKNSQKAFPKPKPTLLGSKLFGKGLVMVEGEKWVKQRKLANHVFHGESLKNMIPAVIASVETMLEKWKGQEGKEIEVHQEFRLLTSEVISRTAFGSSYLDGEKIFNMLNKLSIIVIQNMFKTSIPFISKLWKTADLVESEQLQKGIQDCVMDIIKKREEKAASGEVDGFGDDFLGLLVNAYHDSDETKRLPLEDLVDECKTFYLAGQETVNSLLGWTVLLLSIHRDWQEKARREVIEIFGNQNPHPEGIAKLKNMTMIINETLRLYGPSNGLHRRVGREVQLGKLVLPANVNLVALNIALHHDPQLWGDDVHLFKPERFAEGIAKATNHNASAFFPFGLGSRSCVGMTFATTEAKIALSMILQRYTMTLSPAYVHKPILVITLRPQHGIQIILESLHNDA